MKNTHILVICIVFFIDLQAKPKTTSVSFPVESSRKNFIPGFTLSIYAGGGIAGANAGNPDSKYLAYQSISNVSIPDAQYNSQGGFNAGFDVGLTLGRKKNFGLSLGFLYANSKVTASYAGFHVEYEATDGNGNNFRRLVTATKFSEPLTFDNMNLPLLFCYHTNPGKKLGGLIQFGPVLSIMASAVGKMSATIDYEAVYHYNKGGQSMGYSPTTETGDWQITRAAIAQQLGADQNVNGYFQQLYNRGYYVGLGKSTSGAVSRIKYGISGGALLRAGGIYRATRYLNLLFGIDALFAVNSRKAGSFSPVSTSNDLSNITIANMLNGTSSILTIQTGVFLGLQLIISKK